ncbi:hypothetical protein CLAIMM_10332, partial [Cladophialophora immunda]
MNHFAATVSSERKPLSCLCGGWRRGRSVCDSLFFSCERRFTTQADFRACSGRGKPRRRMAKVYPAQEGQEDTTRDVVDDTREASRKGEAQLEFVEGGGMK